MNQIFAKSTRLYRKWIKDSFYNYETCLINFKVAWKDGSIHIKRMIRMTYVAYTCSKNLNLSWWCAKFNIIKIKHGSRGANAVSC